METNHKLWVFALRTALHGNALCGQNEEVLNVKPSGTYSNHWTLNGQPFKWTWLLYLPADLTLK
jgi:hypothetical protein